MSFLNNGNVDLGDLENLDFIIFVKNDYSIVIINSKINIFIKYMHINIHGSCIEA